MADLSKICNYVEKDDLAGINIFPYLDFGSVPASPAVRSRKRRIKINDILDEIDNPDDEMIEDFSGDPYEQEINLRFKSIGPMSPFKYRGMLDLYDDIIRKLDSLTTPCDVKQISGHHKIIDLINNISWEIAATSRMGPGTSVIIGHSVASKIYQHYLNNLSMEIIVSTLIDKDKIIVCRGNDREVAIGLNVVRDSSKYFMFTTPDDTWRNVIKSVIIQ